MNEVQTRVLGTAYAQQPGFWALEVQIGDNDAFIIEAHHLDNSLRKAFIGQADSMKWQIGMLKERGDGSHAPFERRQARYREIAATMSDEPIDLAAIDNAMAAARRAARLRRPTSKKVARELIKLTRVDPPKFGI